MADFEIRPYNPDTDYSDVEANLMQANLYDADRDTETRLRQFADSIIVAEADIQVVGSVYVVDHIVPSLFRLVVEESHRRQGIGSALVKAGRDRLRESGALDLELFILDRDVELEDYYRQLGFNDGGLYRSMWRYTAETKPRPQN